MVYHDLQPIFLLQSNLLGSHNSPKICSNPNRGERPIFGHALLRPWENVVKYENLIHAKYMHYGTAFQGKMIRENDYNGIF